MLTMEIHLGLKCKSDDDLSRCYHRSRDLRAAPGLAVSNNVSKPDDEHCGHNVPLSRQREPASGHYHHSLKGLMTLKWGGAVTEPTTTRPKQRRTSRMPPKDCGVFRAQQSR